MKGKIIMIFHAAYSFVYLMSRAFLADKENHKLIFPDRVLDKVGMNEGFSPPWKRKIAEQGSMESPCSTNTTFKRTFFR